MRLWIALLAGLVCTVLAAGPAAATSCWRPTAVEHIGSADIIFFGEAVGGQFGAPDNEMRVVEFKVLRAYKGIEAKTVRIEYFNDHGALRGWGFQEGGATLVFADKAADSKAGAPNGTLHYCSMIPYHARTHMHPDYWDILARMKN